MLLLCFYLFLAAQSFSLIFSVSAVLPSDILVIYSLCYSLSSLLITQFANRAFTMYLVKLSQQQIDTVECPGKAGCFKEERKWVGSPCRINMFYFNHFHLPVCSSSGWNLNKDLFS